ncbi:MAG: hypothetical protein HZY75_01080 [Nocardioidaceae bacterium]|nr:MAG: hypothetical protein HZY75_01080 [Nocardioidaceae bacterium]
MAGCAAGVRRHGRAGRDRRRDPAWRALAEHPGTKSSLNPTSLAAGERITFKVSGFPGGETLYIKIDDGKACGDTSQGGCVYHTQKIAKNGTVSGALTLPGDIKPGKHWLRFLASEPVLKPDGSIKGIKGYTLRSPDFTIAAKNNSEPEHEQSEPERAEHPATRRVG